MGETRDQFLGREDPLEKEIVTHSYILAGKSHEQRSLVNYSRWGHRVRHDWVTNTFTFFQDDYSTIQANLWEHKGLLGNI